MVYEAVGDTEEGASPQLLIQQSAKFSFGPSPWGYDSIGPRDIGRGRKRLAKPDISSGTDEICTPTRDMCHRGVGYFGLHYRCAYRNSAKPEKCVLQLHTDL